MDAVQYIQRGVNYIEENLCADLTLEAVAQAAGYSPWHFCRLFSENLGISVMQFAVKRRLAHAVWAMSQGMSATESALLYGFDSLSGFTRAFRREFGLPPRKYLRRHRVLKPERFIIKELSHIMISQNLIHQALSFWGMAADIACPAPTSSGMRSEDTWLADGRLLRVRSSRAPLAIAIAVEEALSAAGLPTAHTLPTKAGESILSLENLFFRMTSCPEGASLPAHAFYEQPAAARALGQTLATMHQAMRSLTHMPELNHANLLKDTLEWSLPRAASALKLTDAFVQSFSEQLTALMPQLPIGPIHRNPTPDAFLFENGVLSGCAEFEMSEVNICLFDPCYAATAILSETINQLPPETISRCWPNMLEEILNGYHMVRPLSCAEQTVVPYVILSIQMLCVAYFADQERFHTLCETNIRMTQLLLNHFFPASKK